MVVPRCSIAFFSSGRSLSFRAATIDLQVQHREHEHVGDPHRNARGEKLHTVERFHLIEGGKVLEVNVHVEDSGAFTTPWDTIQRFDRVELGPMLEAPCAENNLNVGDIEPMPIANKADF